MTGFVVGHVGALSDSPREPYRRPLPVKLDTLRIDVLLSGPQGCGKTRFANELVDWADARGFIVRRTADGVTIQDAGGAIDAPIFNVVEMQS